MLTDVPTPTYATYVEEDGVFMCPDSCLVYESISYMYPLLCLLVYWECLMTLRKIYDTLDDIQL